MTVGAIGSVSSIWTRAASALPSTPDAGVSSATDPDGDQKKTQSASGTAGSTNPLDTLSQDLQAALLQVQSLLGGTQDAAQLQASTGTQAVGGTGQGAQGAGPAHGHHHHHMQDGDAANTPSLASATPLAGSAGVG